MLETLANFSKDILVKTYCIKYRFGRNYFLGYLTICNILCQPLEHILNDILPVKTSFDGMMQKYFLILKVAVTILTYAIEKIEIS